jgi:hypothetical protein
MIGAHFGWLFGASGSPMDRILANAVRWANPARPTVVLMSPSASRSFNAGVWSGDVAVLGLATNVTLSADDGNGHRGVSNPFNVMSDASPQPLTAKRGGSSSLGAIVSGTWPLNYQWRKDELNLQNMTNDTLVIPSAQTNDAGTYSVVVTNVYGAVTSSPVQLAILDEGPPTVDHFAWGLIPSPQFRNVPFVATVLAQDATNGIVSAFNRTLSLAAATAASGVSVPLSTDHATFVQGIWTEHVAVAETGSNILLRVEEAGGVSGSANPITVLEGPWITAKQLSGTVLLQWPAEAALFVLESSDRMAPDSWRPVISTPILSDGQFVVPVDMRETNRFFRLRFPAP